MFKKPGKIIEQRRINPKEKSFGREKSLKDFLINHRDSNMVSFHMPGHKGGDFFRKMGYESLIESLVDMDITEIPGADNLYEAESVIRRIMDRYKSFYGSKESFLSVGGSSAGLIASILASVSEMNGSYESPLVIIARNSHKSIYNGVRLSGAKVRYVYPEIIDDLNIQGEIKAASVEEELEKAEKEGLKVASVVVGSPNYYGILSDIKAISEVCHRYDVPLIVDQAHGAHLKLFDGIIEERNTLSAENQGADVVVNSTHKTLASFTQSAVVNLLSNRISKELLEDKLQMIQSSSPSYMLMLSLELNIEILEKRGRELAYNWIECLESFYPKVKEIPGLNCFTHPMHDKSKILLDFRDAGLSGNEAFDLLKDEGIILELCDSNLAMAMTGIGNTVEDYDRLLDALNSIGKSRINHSLGQEKSENKGNRSPGGESLFGASFGESLEKEDLQLGITEEEEGYLDSLVGTYAVRAIIPYPPGIPLVAPGEIIEKYHIDKVKELRRKGQKVLGIR